MVLRFNDNTKLISCRICAKSENAPVYMYGRCFLRQPQKPTAVSVALLTALVMERRDRG